MIKHYLSIAFRNLFRHKSYTLLNLLGLAIGLACCLLIMLYVQHELSYDRFHSKADRIYRLVREYNSPSEQMKVALSPTAALPVMQREFPEIETGVRIFNVSLFSPVVVRNKEKVYQEDRFFYADSAFFDVFTLQLLKGQFDQALTEPYTLILTRSAARRYFDEANPIGQSLEVGSNKRAFRVTAVVEDLPENSHFHFDLMASFASHPASKKEIWGSANYYTYLLLKEGQQAAQLEAKFPALMKRELGEYLSEGEEVRAELQALTDIHLRSNLYGEIEPAGSITYIYLLSGIALLVLIIACINYMNLATARSLDRAKEVSLKKVFGAMRQQLASQFIAEAILMSSLATLFAMGIAWFSLPYFNQLAQRELTATSWLNPSFGLVLLGSALFVGLLAGAYPAFAFSAFNPATALKGSFKRSGKGQLLRKGLVVFQFAVSMVLIVSTLVVQKQLGYIQSQNLGYDKEQLLVLPVDRKIREHLASFKAELSNHPDITMATATSEPPTDVGGTYSISKGWNEDENQTSEMVKAISVDKDFAQTLRLDFLAGEDLSEADARNEEQFTFLLNELAVHRLGWDPEECIGKKVNLNGRKGVIKGVVKNFHIASLHQPIDPLVMFISSYDYYHLLVKFKPEQASASLTHIKTAWANRFAHRPFSYQFLDDEFASLYRSEERMGNIFALFSGLAIFIACLGLFGLASFSTLQRAKEVSIRKILGASVSNLLMLLSRDFALLVGLAFLLAAPLSWWVMNTWLEGFAFRTEVGLGTLLIAGGVSLLIAMLTVSYQSIRTATSNPIDWLKDE